MATLIQRTHFSISTDETRANLNSALFEWEGETVRVVTTDGHRLSKVEFIVPGRQASVSMLLPLKAVQELRRLCEDTDLGAADSLGEVKITPSGVNAFFQFGSLIFCVKLVDAQFPPYGQVIPARSERVVVAPRISFAETLKAVSVAASERTGGVKVSLSNGVMKVSCESPDSGDGFDELSVEYVGSDISVGFNAKYFLDILAAIQSEFVEISFSGELDPAVVRPCDDKYSPCSFLAVVMPMRI
jgi:DNA polymerase-3 subunit beta